LLPACGPARRLTGTGPKRLAADLFALTTPRAANRLLLLDATQLAARDMPALATHRTQDAGVGHALAKAAQQLLLTFALLKSD